MKLIDILREAERYDTGKKNKLNIEQLRNVIGESVYLKKPLSKVLCKIEAVELSDNGVQFILREQKVKLSGGRLRRKAKHIIPVREDSSRARVSKKRKRAHVQACPHCHTVLSIATETCTHCHKPLVVEQTDEPSVDVELVFDDTQPY